MKQLMMYSPIYSFTAEEFITKLQEVPNDEDIKVRMNSPGGSPFAGWGMIAALQERKGKNFLHIDGNASSMAFYMIPFFDEVSALDVTSFMVHRAYGYVSNADDQKILDKINKDLRSKMEKRVDSEKFLEVTGISIKDLFEAEERRDIWITAKEAKNIGLIDKVVRLKPREIEAFKENLVAFSMFDEDALQGSEVEEQGSSIRAKKKTEDNNNNINKTDKKMTVEDIKNQHPEAYSQIVEVGIKQERNRTGAWLAFSKIDPEAVTKGIEEGHNVDQKVIAEMSAKAIAAIAKKDIEDESQEAIDTSKKEDKVKTAEQKAEAEFQEGVRKAAGLKPEKEEK